MTRRGYDVPSVLIHSVLAGLLAVAGMTSGCGGATGPSAPSPPNTPPVAPVNPPFVAAVFPSTGSTGGGTAVTIAGSGFQAGATVTLGAIRQTSNVENNTTIRMTTSAHDAGACRDQRDKPGRPSRDVHRWIQLRFTSVL